MRLVSDGLYNEDVKENLEKLEIAKSILTVKLNTLSTISKTPSLNRDDIVSVIQTNIDKLNSTDKNYVKTLLQKYIKLIKLEYPYIEIHFRFNVNISPNPYLINIDLKNSQNKTKALRTSKSSQMRLAPLVGLEPTTYRLTAGRSTN